MAPRPRPAAPLAAVLALALALSAAGCRRGPPPAADAAGFGIDAARGEEAPAVELTAQDGSHLSLASLKGQVVLVNFWATWCPPCREEMPSMIALGRELEARHPGKFKLVAVSVDEGWDPVRAFIAGAPYGGKTPGCTVALDRPDQATTIAYYCAARGGCPGEYKFPESYIVDRRGRLVSYVVGPRDWSDPRARTYLESLIE
jgi:thiol-disulfide isomerase/thioredoxin